MSTDPVWSDSPRLWRQYAPVLPGARNCPIPKQNGCVWTSKWWSRLWCSRLSNTRSKLRKCIAMMIGLKPSWCSTIHGAFFWHRSPNGHRFTVIPHLKLSYWLINHSVTTCCLTFASGSAESKRIWLHWIVISLVWLPNQWPVPVAATGWSRGPRCVATLVWGLAGILRYTDNSDVRRMFRKTGLRWF